MDRSATTPLTAPTRICKTLNVCGGSACIRSTRIPVWSLVLWRKKGVPDRRLLTMYPTLTQDDLDAAWKHHAANLGEIENDIQGNENS